MKLNLGCGKDIKKGWVNVDYKAAKGIKVIHDLNEFPYPFKDNSVDEILMDNILEHLLNPHKTMLELSRILKPKSKVTILVPHFTSIGAHDILHKTYWSSGQFNVFLKTLDKKKVKSLELHVPVFDRVEKHISFFKGKLIWNYLIEFLVNRSESSRLFYEHHFCYIFPAAGMKAIFLNGDWG